MYARISVHRRPSGWRGLYGSDVLVAALGGGFRWMCCRLLLYNRSFLGWMNPFLWSKK